MMTNVFSYTVRMLRLAFNRPIATALIVASLGLFSSPALGQKVKKVIKKKKRVLIDMGKDDGVTKGTKVCFFKKSKKKRVTCGKVIKAWGNKSYVKVKSIKKVKKGMEAAIATKGKKKKGKEKMMAGGWNSSLIKANYLMTLATPSAYNNLSYQYDQNNGTFNTLWQTETATSASLIGFGLDYEMPFMSNTLAVGGKYRVHTSSQGKVGSFIESNFGPNANRYLRISQTSTSLGFFADYLYLDFPMSKNLMFKVGNGLDLDMATMTMTADELDDNDAGVNKRIYEVSSAATTISLRTVANAYMKFGSFGLGAGFNFMLPLTTSLSQSAAADNQYANQLVGSTPEEDVLRMIDHRKNTFGMELIFSAYYSL